MSDSTGNAIQWTPDEIQNSGLERFLNEPSSLKSRYVACMILSAAGDALGFRNGDWEFETNGIFLHKKIDEMGGVKSMALTGFIVSDDTVMHIATAEALIDSKKDLDAFYPLLAKKYVECFDDMTGRAPGGTTRRFINLLKSGTPWNQIPFYKTAGGCGGSMRAMCIGLVFFGEKQRDKLIAASIESGRLTHNNPTGFLGALMSASFTAFALEGKPVVSWGRELLSLLHQAYAYLEKVGRDWNDYQHNLKYFEGALMHYLKARDILDPGKDTPIFPSPYGVPEREEFYTSLSYDGWGGSGGHDSVLIAYDSLLGCHGSWEEFCLRGVFHGGDSDTTGTIGAGWYGSLYGFKNVILKNLEGLEYKDRLVKVAESLYEISQ